MEYSQSAQPAKGLCGPGIHAIAVVGELVALATYRKSNEAFADRPFLAIASLPLSLSLSARSLSLAHTRISGTRMLLSFARCSRLLF